MRCLSSGCLLWPLSIQCTSRLHCVFPFILMVLVFMSRKRTFSFSLYLSFPLPQPPSPFQHCPLDIFQRLRFWRQYSCYVLILFMLFLQSRISWICVDHFHYLVIWLTDKNTSSEAHNILFCALLLILIVVFHLFFLT